MSSKASSSAVTNGQDQPHNEKKKKPLPATEQTSTSISSLPHDLLLNCLARVSRLYYPTLSLVSKQFRSIIASTELYQTRSSLNRTEKCLYLCLRFPLDPQTYWSTLCRLPSRKIVNGSRGYFMKQISSPKYLPPSQSSTLVSVGSDIYKIGGANDLFVCKIWKRNYSSSVSVLDCRSHTWRQAPSMGMKRDSSSTATLVDGKIYVAGGCDDKYVSYPNWMEVFDIETQTWGSVTNPRVFELHHEFRNKGFVAKSLLLEGKLYMFGDDSMVYNPEESRWEDIGVGMRPMSWPARSCVSRSCHCVIDDVLFFWDRGVFKWYDLKENLWKKLKGIEGLPDLSDREYCKMVDLGGKIGFLWSEYLYTQTKPECRIWCAEITFERRDGAEIWGKVEWFDYVLRADLSCSSFDVVSPSV